MLAATCFSRILMPTLYFFRLNKIKSPCSCVMAGHHHNNTHASRMDHVNRFQSEAQPFGPKLFMHSRTDAANGALPSGYVGAPIRPNGIPFSSHTGQSHIQHSDAPGTMLASYSGYPLAGSSSSTYAPHNTHHLPALSYPHRSDDNFILSSHMDDRRVALKRRNPIIYPVDGVNNGSCYAGSSSNPQFPCYMPPNPIPAPEPCPPRITSNMGSSYWTDQPFGSNGGSQRNVRGRHDHNPIHLGHNPGVACATSSTHGPPHHANVIGPQSTAVPQNRAYFSIPPRVTAPGSDGNCSMVFREGTYYSAPQRTNINAPPVLAPPGSSDSLHFVHGGYAPRAAPPNSISTYPAPAFATPNNSVTVTHEPDIPCYRPAVPGYPPATSAAAAAASVHAEGAAASSRHLGHVALGSSGSARSRRLRDSYHAFRPLVIEENNLRGPATERFMMLNQLFIHESREDSDPHWDMRLDIDDMSYEELLALGERIGNVNTGLADEKLSSCVTEIPCCSSARTHDDNESARCVICLEDYKFEDSVGKLKCNHKYHADCIKKWLQVKNACPVCKASAADDGGGTE
ncbi:E3 ubiquitin-protein ligase MBR2 [Zea mays]|uniref:RING-type E3 ubiquitin transferase n=3 Tax=Zea mays TaxID=4577 RepID=A0A1D6LYM1_MAIZE|nr:E3 ubiquitin-protein ligase MBR2 [Zea mays]